MEKNDYFATLVVSVLNDYWFLANEHGDQFPYTPNLMTLLLYPPRSFDIIWG